MPPMVHNFIAWTYTDDTGRDWRTKALKGITDQNKMGGSPAAASLPALPSTIKPRRIQLWRSRADVQARRSVVVYSVPCPILTPGASVNLTVRLSGIDQVQAFRNIHYPRSVLVPERHPRKGALTSQTA
jgi:hypothetical protein